jgi:hypothetical protein
MARSIRILTAALLALGLTASAASALDIQAGGQPKLKATKIQLGIISPEDNTCPGDAKMTIWVFSNKPGTIPVLVVRKNGTVSGPHMVETKKGANNKSMGVWSQDLNIITPIEAEYRVVTPNSSVASNWVPLYAEC